MLAVGTAPAGVAAHKVPMSWDYLRVVSLWRIAVHPGETECWVREMPVFIG
jgi:hypothetical protein